jgi:hypothetical protein
MSSALHLFLWAIVVRVVAAFAIHARVFVTQLVWHNSRHVLECLHAEDVPCFWQNRNCGQNESGEELRMRVTETKRAFGVALDAQQQELVTNVAFLSLTTSC